MKLQLSQNMLHTLDQVKIYITLNDLTTTKQDEIINITKGTFSLEELKSMRFMIVRA